MTTFLGAWTAATARPADPQRTARMAAVQALLDEVVGQLDPVRARADVQLGTDVADCQAELRAVHAEIADLTPDPPAGTAFESVVERRRRLADLIAYRPVVERRLAHLQQQYAAVVDRVRADLRRIARETVELRLRAEIRARAAEIERLQQLNDDQGQVISDLRSTLGQVGSGSLPLAELVEPAGARALG